jgi:hypothetical protein
MKTMLGLVAAGISVAIALPLALAQSNVSRPTEPLPSTVPVPLH